MVTGAAGAAAEVEMTGTAGAADEVEITIGAAGVVDGLGTCVSRLRWKTAVECSGGTKWSST